MKEAERAAAKEAFLKAYALNGNILLACRHANVDRSTVDAWCEHDEIFSLRKNQALRDFADVAFGEFVRRAIQGYDKIVVSMGKIVYNPDGTPLKERVVSDRLLEMIIKRHFPEYKDKQQLEHTGKDGEPLPGLVINVPEVTMDTWARYSHQGTRQSGEDTQENSGESDGSAEPGLS